MRNLPHQHPPQSASKKGVVLHFPSVLSTSAQAVNPDDHVHRSAQHELGSKRLSKRAMGHLMRSVIDSFGLKYVLVSLITISFYLSPRPLTGGSATASMRKQRGVVEAKTPTWASQPVLGWRFLRVQQMSGAQECSHQINATNANRPIRKISMLFPRFPARLPPLIICL